MNPTPPTTMPLMPLDVEPDVTLTGRVAQVLDTLAVLLRADRDVNLGFPSTLDLKYKPLWPFFSAVLNNVGDPFATSAYPRNTKHLETEVLGWFATLLHAPHQGWWGVTTSGGTEGIEYGIVHARDQYPDTDPLVIHSTAAHNAVPKLCRHLRLPAIAIKANHRGELDLADFRTVVDGHRHRPLIVVATVGTTMTESVDDVRSIRHVLDDLAVTWVWVHADAALAGLPLALLPPGSRPGFDLADGADSISISAHKFLGCPFPAGIYLTTHPQIVRGSTVDYIGTADTTLAGSRSGHAPLVMWYAINVMGTDGLRERAHECRRVAAYTVERLQGITWNAWRHPHGMTVVLDTPPAEITQRFSLASSGGKSHLITMPHVTTTMIDTFVQQLAAFVPHTPARTDRRFLAATLPGPRTPAPNGTSGAV